MIGPIKPLNTRLKIFIVSKMVFEYSKDIDKINQSGSQENKVLKIKLSIGGATTIVIKRA